MTHANNFVDHLSSVLNNPVFAMDVTHMAEVLVNLRERGGRLFCLGVGGGAANAAHAVNDFRKLCAIEAYAPSDGIAELTARANDEGWNTIFTEWLRTSNISHHDAIMVFSVGGGQARASVCILEAVMLARQVKARVLGIVGRADGETAKATNREYDVIVAEAYSGRLAELVTPITETMQVAVLHALVSDPRLMCGRTKW